MKRTNIGSAFFIFFMLFLFVSTFISCSKYTYSNKYNNKFIADSKIVDYSNLHYWAAHPWKKDASDSVPKPLLNTLKQDSLADVFFIHPTTLINKKENYWNADIDNLELNKKTDNSAILYQASVFNECCRVFAPRYRQAHIKAFFIKNKEAEMAFEAAYADIKVAFLYYLKNYNNKQPIIIASHSQGTKHAARLLKEFFENKALQKQLVCAYIIGMPIPENYFSNIKPCKDSLATGCFVSWRTFKNGTPQSKLIASEQVKAIVINPLTWTNGAGLFSANLNMGAVLKNFNKIVPNAVNTEIYNNILWSSKPNIPWKIFYFKKNYHIGDINLFYVNIRRNAMLRINAFLDK